MWKQSALVVVAILCTSVATLGIIRYLALVRTVPNGSELDPKDAPAVLRANNRGVGHMEQFDYEKAVADFEEVNHLAPGWLPGRINLGIALFNTSKDENLARARSIFEDILKADPKNP